MEEYGNTKLAGIDDGIVSVAAIYWAQCLIGKGGGVYTQFIPDLGAMNKDFKDHWGYVATWDLMKPDVAKSYDTEVSDIMAVVHTP